MKLGTIVYDNKIYNLDYMTSEEVKEMIYLIESNKLKNIYESEKLINN